jgi:hypothetical protein
MKTTTKQLNQKEEHLRIYTQIRVDKRRKPSSIN